MLKMLTVAGSSAIIALVAVAPVAAPGARDGPRAQKIAITIRSGDRVGAGNFALAPGVRVRVTVTNYTHQFHTFTVRALGVSELIWPARHHQPRRTRFSFTARQWGSFPWHCLICPSGQHGLPRAMGGTLYVIVDPSALP